MFGQHKIGKGARDKASNLLTIGHQQKATHSLTEIQFENHACVLDIDFVILLLLLFYEFVVQ